MSRLERGQANPALDMVERLAEGLGVTPDALFSASKTAAVPQKPESLVPFDSQGGHFDKKLCKHPDGVYKVGNKDDDVTFAKYEDALSYLRRMGQAQWMRPNVSGKWGYVTATSWREKPKP